MLPSARALALARLLDLDFEELPICLPCLSIVMLSLDNDDEPKIRGALVSMTPNLWAEGLEAPAREALERAAAKGIPDAAQALADLDARGARTPAARAIVRRLGEDMAYRSKAWYATLVN